LTFPPAFQNVRAVLQATDRSTFVVGIKKTAQLHLIFGVALSLAVVLAIFVKF